MTASAAQMHRETSMPSSGGSGFQQTVITLSASNAVLLPEEDSPTAAGSSGRQPPGQPPSQGVGALLGNIGGALAKMQQGVIAAAKTLDPARALGASGLAANAVGFSDPVQVRLRTAESIA